MDLLGSNNTDRETQPINWAARLRPGWKLTGVALLGWMGAALGCTSPGGPTREPAALAVSAGSALPDSGSSTAPGVVRASSAELSTGSEGPSLFPSDSAGSPERISADLGPAASAASVAAPSTPLPAAAPAAAPSEVRPVLTSNRWAAQKEAPKPSPAPKPDSGSGPGSSQGIPKPATEREMVRTAQEDLVRAGVGSPGSAVTPVIPAPVKEYPINLAASLRLAGADNPTIALAQAQVGEALALQLHAQTLLLPNLRMGGNYHYHDGTLLASFGFLRKVTSQSLYYGFGARTVAAESVAFPGVQVYSQLTDAFFEPLAARQDVANRRFQAAATNNNILLDVATAYLALLGAEGRLAVIRQSETEFGEVARLTESYAKVELGRKADANRAATDLALLRVQEQRAQEEVATAAAELSRLLNLDPSVRLRTDKDPVQVVQLIDSHVPVEQLIQVAVRYRPELRAGSAAVAAAQTHWREERARPFLPLLAVGYSYGQFGGGSLNLQQSAGQAYFGNFNNRTDVDVMALWSLQNLGFGNVATIRQRRAQVREALAERDRVLNQVRQEVLDAFALSGQRFREVDVARRELESSLRAYYLDYTRIYGKAQNALPLELLNSAKLLARGRQALVAAIIGYDQAQFQLFVALGQPPTLALDDHGAPTPPAPVPAVAEPARQEK